MIMDRPRSQEHAIRRRPVGAAPAAFPNPGSEPPPRYEEAVDDLLDDYFALPVSAPPAKRPDCGHVPFHHEGLKLDTHVPQPQLRVPIARSPAQLSPTSPALSISPGFPSRNASLVTPDTPSYLCPPTPGTPAPAIDTTSPSPSSSSSSSLSKPFWKTAIDETIYFAGGLISHPAESTRHFTVLRHSPGLIYYKGPSTKVTITIFSSDGPLPPGRTLWLQRKGFSGHMGMDASAFFRTDSSWIDVTPNAQVMPSEVPAEDERAWQRDINKFIRKAADHKRLSKHRAAETCVIRVPAAAADGYMRIVVCAGTSSDNPSSTRKKSLCPSPVFRIASTSRDMSVVRGAGLKTLPLELGIRAATAVGEKYITTVAAPVIGAVQAGLKRVEPMVMVQNPRAMAVVHAGASEGLGIAENRYAPIRQGTWDSLYETDFNDAPPEVVGADSGPVAPFPIAMHGRVVKGTGIMTQQTGIPTANLAGVSGDLMLRLGGGVYIGWAQVQQQQLPKGDLQTDQQQQQQWYMAIITIGPPLFGRISVAARNGAYVHLIQEPHSPPLNILDARLDVIIMTYLRPLLRRDPIPLPQQIAAAYHAGIQICMASLSREKWHHHHHHQLVTDGNRNPFVKALKTHKSFSDFASHASAGIQRRVDSVPLHWAGVRTTGNELKDHTYGLGGFYIKR